MADEPTPEPEAAAAPTPLAKPGPPVPYIIYCYDRQRYLWSDAHGSCECHKKRFLHRD